MGLNDIMSENLKKVREILNILNTYLFSFYGYWMCFHSCFTSLIGIPVGITISAVETKICEITAIINKFKPIITKKKKKHDKMVLSAKPKLNSTDVLISIAVIDSCISHNEFVFVNIELGENVDMKEKTQNLKASAVNRRF